MAAGSTAGPPIISYFIEMTTLPALTSALADPSRVRILSALRGRRELCACHLIELLALAPSTISKHMDTLRAAGLILARRDGKWMHYRLPGHDGPILARATLTWLFRAVDLDEDARAQSRSDAGRLKAILKLNPEALCCTQRKSGPGKAVPTTKPRQANCCGPACCSSAPETPAARRWPKAGRTTSRAR